MTYGYIRAPSIEPALDRRAIGDVGTYTLATLPNPALWDRRTIWVTDLWMGTTAPGGRMVSEGGNWKPSRPWAFSSIAVPASDMIIQPYHHGTTVELTGVFSVLRNFTLGTGSGYAVPYPGHRRRFVRRTGGLIAAVIQGVNLLNGAIEFEWNGSAYVQVTSGVLL